MKNLLIVGHGQFVQIANQELKTCLDSTRQLARKDELIIGIDFLKANLLAALKPPFAGKRRDFGVIGTKKLFFFPTQGISGRAFRRLASCKECSNVESHSEAYANRCMASQPCAKLTQLRLEGKRREFSKPLCRFSQPGTKLPQNHRIHVIWRLRNQIVECPTKATLEENRPAGRRRDFCVIGTKGIEIFQKKIVSSKKAGNM
jgi:hypothetical protein